MNRQGTKFDQRSFAFATFALQLLSGCGARNQDGSGATNWLQCKTAEDCSGTDALTCAHDGYCVDENGRRVARPSSDENPVLDTLPSVPHDAAGPTVAMPSQVPGTVTDASRRDAGTSDANAPAESTASSTEMSASQPVTGSDAGLVPPLTTSDAQVVPCGNSTIDADEDCDDGNTRDDDGCSAACVLEPGFVCGAAGSACNRSCAGMTGNECQGANCCESPTVPGGTFEYQDRTRTISSFRLDKFEVTVGRFRAYMAAVDEWQAAGNPREGAGAHPEVPDSGWRPDWLIQDMFLDYEGSLKPEFVAEFTPGSSTYLAPNSDTLAINQLTWHVAYAFCIWDGGRLPSAIEWNYAAVGGAEQRRYPWGETPSAQENLEQKPPALPVPDNWYGEVTSWTQILGIPVGSQPASVGRFGHMDLNTGVWERLRDTGVAETADDLITLVDDEIFETYRLEVGGSWQEVGKPMPVYAHKLAMTGIRCARDL